MAEQYQHLDRVSDGLNVKFSQLPAEDQLEMLLSDVKFDLHPENAERFFELALPHSRFDSVRSKFTPEIMARYGRDAEGKLTEKSMELGVQFYGTRMLRGT